MEKYEVTLNRPSNISVPEMTKYIQEAVCLYPTQDKRFDLQLPITVRKI